MVGAELAASQRVISAPSFICASVPSVSLVIRTGRLCFSRRPVQGGFACTFLETSQNDRARKPTRTVLDIDDFDDAVFFAVALSTNQDGTAAPISRLGLHS